MTDTIWTESTVAAAVGRAKYDRLAQAIRDRIASGSLAPGQKLPPVRDLAWKVGVTPGTVSRAYRLLTDAGVLTAGVGRGTFVAEAEEVSRQVLSAEAGPDNDSVLNLTGPRMPDLGQTALIARVMQTTLAQMPSDVLTRYPSRITDRPAREIVLAGLDPLVGPATLEDVVLAYGGQNAIVMILQTVLNGPRPTILTDAISYNGFRNAAEVSRADLVTVPWDDAGPVPDVFVSLVRKHGAQAYCTASEVNNPTARPIAPSRRQEIAAIAARHGVHVIDDDCYTRPTRVGASFRSLLPDLGWHVGSPSKTFSPALRLGYAVAPEGWSGALVRTAAGHAFGVSPLVTDLYARLYRHPDQAAVLRAVRDRIDRDVAVATEIFADCGPGAAPGVPFVWLPLPAPWRSGDFVEAAKSRGVILRASESFLTRDSPPVHAVRIAVNGTVPHARFAAGMADLRAVMDQPSARISV
ncbi:PLP-dependent aminotransferase family protein [Salipiger sp. IMCC34102]|uniref:aminotransferase-like domain-containing protein n=1 Tax=Salipiger sp. IMCC34102 TaxID=2510647 RepID=UPI001F5CC5A1|nr:PLP-dependent aminotransferase family protein [Salipiger sp. IMCC34102]